MWLNSLFPSLSVCLTHRHTHGHTHTHKTVSSLKSSVTAQFIFQYPLSNKGPTLCSGAQWQEVEWMNEWMNEPTNGSVVMAEPSHAHYQQRQPLLITRSSTACFWVSRREWAGECCLLRVLGCFRCSAGTTYVMISGSITEAPGLRSNRPFPHHFTYGWNAFDLLYFIPLLVVIISGRGQEGGPVT